MDKEAFMKSGLIEEYVLGLSTAEDKALVEQMAQEDEDISVLLQETRESMEHFCRSVRKPTPPHVKERIIRTLKRRSRASKGGMIRKMDHSQSIGIWQRVGPLAAGMAILFLVSAGLLWDRNQSLKTALNSRELTVNEMMEEMNALITDHKDLKSQFAFLQDLNTFHITLDDLGKTPSSMVMIYWNEAMQKAVLRMMNLPAPPAGMTYQLWADVEGDMKNMGIITDGNSNWTTLPFIRRAESLNITLEKMGGSAKPNVEKLIASGKI